MKVAFVCFLVVLLAVFTQDCSARHNRHNIETRAVLAIEERSIWDELNALARLPGDLTRRDFVSLFLDLIILSQFLPLPWIIATPLNLLFKVLKFIQPAYWWLFPSTKPANVKGYGFSKLN